MRKGILYLFAAGALALIVSMAWWTNQYIAKNYGPWEHVVLAGETVTSIAGQYGVPPQRIAEANDLPSTDAQPQPGTELTVPAPESTTWSEWGTHLLGLAGTVLGVFMSLWLALVAGLLPKPIRRQLLGISLVLGISSYAASAAVAGPVLLTPAYIFGTIKDGFAWAAAFPMLARALGIRDTPPPEEGLPEPLTVEEPEASAAA